VKLLSAPGHQFNIYLGFWALIRVISLVLKRIKQPYIIVYTLTGVNLGRYVLPLVIAYETVYIIGEF
jgi:Kef-type K+ transport system membrane component KefB